MTQIELRDDDSKATFSDDVDPVLDSYFHAKANDNSNPKSNSKKSGIITNGYPPTDSNNLRSTDLLCLAFTMTLIDGLIF